MDEIELKNCTGKNMQEWEQFGLVFSKRVETFIQAFSHNSKDFKLSKTVFDWSSRRSSSRGGKYSCGYGYNISMVRALYVRGLTKIYEYASFDNDNEIGGFYTDRTEDNFKMVILHEIAHAWQFFKADKGWSNPAPHGDLFKDCYRLLRNHFLNPYLPNQIEYKQKYNLLKDSITAQIWYDLLDTTPNIPKELTSREIKNITNKIQFLGQQPILI